MHKFRAALVGLLCLAAITGCSTNTNIANVNFTTVAKLQLAMGTLNDPSGTLTALAGSTSTCPCLNAVSTFRNQLGNSAFLHPGDATLTPGSGPKNIGNSAFALGLFAYGQNPGINGLKGAGPGAAWAPGTDTGFLIDLNGGGPIGDFLTPIATGSYSLTDSLVVNGQTQTYSAAAALTSAALLPVGNVVSYVPTAGTGGGTLTITAPGAGVTEQLVVIVGPGNPGCAAADFPANCSPIAPPVFPVLGCHFTACPPGVSDSVVAEFETTGVTTVITVPPGTLATPSAAQPNTPIPYTAFVMDADFPWVESGPKAAGGNSQTPVITNSVNGQADLSAGATTNFLST